jgi:hypothetical protein
LANWRADPHHHSAGDFLALAVVEGLSEVRDITDISHWGVMTIGTVLATRDAQTAPMRR